MTAPTLVTGATGFVGSAVARTLLQRGHSLRLMARKGADLTNMRDLPAERVEGDLSAPATFADAVRGCRYVFHVAADYRLWVPDPAPMMTANVEGTLRLMLAAQDAGVERIVYCSSVAALGLIGDGTVSDEDTPVHEHSVIGIYKRSKYRAEQEVLRLVRERGLPAVIVNPSTPVGPRDIKPTPTGQMILDCAAGNMPAYVDTGVNIVHVDDVAEGHALALERGRIGEKYILGSENLALRDLFAMTARIAGVKPPRVSLPQEVIWPVAVVSEWLSRGFGIAPRVTREMLAMSRKKMFFSSAKAERELGYAPRPARDAVTDAVTWFRQNGMLK
ncbi:epimerase [Gluconacetobacter sacchari DSM 12717]|uniref:NAD-dependent epimerase/dehydratase family protein n=2 Tax=Gluconacetobacter sacchari TaxID=92759 RepID=A0A7W4IEC1_9PROT|nr:hopanoid-associated sugar epimerase [Gluconacetobacter sacchari]MBB2161290.1 NAD-dependent epimerase/dehydratase family protein [Gluconacetobacter sacchari]GBQ23636.1 epimerase [Gluconacetobacter sacchari DSM 12717]